MQRALVFVSRCQNLRDRAQPDRSSPRKNPDGGFYYTIAAGGSSQAGNTDNGGLRSYGSMTYAGLKSMIYAGVDKDDQRVKAAVEWIGKNYTLDENPGMGDAGLYYYYHTFAKALDADGRADARRRRGRRARLAAGAGRRAGRQRSRPTAVGSTTTSAGSKATRTW